MIHFLPLIQVKFRLRLYPSVCMKWNLILPQMPHARSALLTGTLCMGLLATGAAQTSAPAAAATTAPAGEPVTITLDEAIRRAEASEPGYATAAADSRVAGLDRWNARAAMLPNARFLSQGIYTQPNGLFAEGGEGVTTPNPKFVSNDARPREYIDQGVVDERLSLADVAAVHRADAVAAMARAQLEIARRGLVATVTSLFYTSLAADHKLAVAGQARQEAADFTALTEKREQAREAAHADVIKARLTGEQRDRDLEDARVAAEMARLNLAVLLFPDPRTPYMLKASEAVEPLTSRADVDAAAAKNNPELKSALSALKASDADVLGARAALLPTLDLNVAYGIDANEFAVNGPMTSAGQARNLGYSTTYTVNLPIWDWLSTEHKVKQSEIRRDAARVALTATQRQLIARLDETYSEAVAARNALVSLGQSVADAAESLRLTKLRYTSGDATVLEVVDAQTTYLTTENAREDGRVRYEMARANLQMLTGTM